MYQLSLMLSHFELITRIAVGAGLGGIIGLERDLHGRHAGLRTHLIVALASATFMVVSAHFIYYQGYDGSHPIEADASRIAASVVSGVGFLAGGAILKTGGSIQGLTTAAGLWLVTAIGLCAGAGMYIESVAVTVMGMIALTFLRLFEDKDDKRVTRHVSLVFDERAERIDQVIEALSSIGAEVTDFDYERRIHENTVGMTFEVRFPVKLGVGKVINLLEKQDGLRHVHVKLHG